MNFWGSLARFCCAFAPSHLEALYLRFLLIGLHMKIKTPAKHQPKALISRYSRVFLIWSQLLSELVAPTDLIYELLWFSWSYTKIITSKCRYCYKYAKINSFYVLIWCFLPFKSKFKHTSWWTNERTGVPIYNCKLPSKKILKDYLNKYLIP